MTISIVDTSVLVELLGVDGRTATHETILAGYQVRVEAREQFLLPIAVLFETGNHIARAEDGGRRRDLAGRFLQLVTSSVDGHSPFSPTPMPTPDVVRQWLPGFEDDAMRGIGLVDRSLIHTWELQRGIHPMRRVYIWSLDEHLSGYDTGP